MVPFRATEPVQQKGVTYSRSTTGTGMPSKNAFSTPRACFNALGVLEITSFDVNCG